VDTDTAGYCRIRIWNRIEKNTEKRIRIYPFSYHIRNGYEYGYSGYRYRIFGYPFPLSILSETPRSYLHLAHLVRSYTDEFTSLRQSSPETAVPKQRGLEASTCWFCQSQLRWSFQSRIMLRGWGFVLRDEEGRVISSGKLETALEPIHTEIVACLQALQRAAELGVQRD
jgi:hypothetical protein